MSEPALVNFEEPLSHQPEKDPSRTAEELLGDLREEIRKQLTLGPPRIEEVAVILQLSSRTLQRRLAHLGTSFQKEADEARRQLALERVSVPGFGINQLTSLLRYSDARAFLRAFRRWTGTTPGQYRRCYTAIGV